MDRRDGDALMTIDSRSYRLDNIHLLRGLAIVLMAIDHVRDYVMIGAAHDPTTDPDVSPALFFTRWITHFCAPVFVFLAGTSAGLMTARKSAPALAAFLFTRGLWLIAVEVFVISTAWTFSPGGIPEMGGSTVMILQVIWAIGASMVVLAGAQYLGRRTCLVLGLVIVLGHNALDGVWPATQIMDRDAPWWVVLHSQASYALGPFLLIVAYPLLPWIGVMLLGFGSAALFEQAPSARDRSLLRWGLGLTAGFVLLRLADVYGDPNTWQAGEEAMATLMDFVNVTKYPPSLLFLLMTLGPAAVLCARADAIPDAVRRILITFGRAPFAFYVAHLYLIHALSVALGTAQGHEPGQMMTFMFFYPEGFGLPLPGVYLAWALVVAMLYPLCRWVVAVKARRRDWWLSYL